MRMTSWFRRGQRYRPETVAAALYQAVGGRAPDQAVLGMIAARMTHDTSLNEIVTTILNSPDIQESRVVSIGRLDELPANEITLDLSLAERQALWQHVARVWEKLGASVPYRSVLTRGEFHKGNITDERIESFYESGRQDIERLAHYLTRNGRALPADGVCVDFGCGLGRTTVHLAERCRRVIAMDVSEPHLAAARGYLGARGFINVEFRLVRSAADLAAIGGFDLFHSIITLQHNPPPLIAEILDAAFAGLNPGGNAFFQVPTYEREYRWDIKSYLADVAPRKRMEMHVLPQAVIFASMLRAGCVPLEVQPDGCTGIAKGISNTFLVARPDRS